jgi:hypothetical protein
MMQSSVTRRSNWRETGSANDRFDPKLTLNLSACYSVNPSTASLWQKQVSTRAMGSVVPLA